MVKLGGFFGSGRMGLRAFYFVSSKYVDLILLYVLGVHRKATNAAGT